MSLLRVSVLTGDTRAPSCTHMHRRPGGHGFLHSDPAPLSLRRFAGEYRKAAQVRRHLLALDWRCNG